MEDDMSSSTQAPSTEGNVPRVEENTTSDYMPTVLVLGGTGVGKSSLINAILGLRTPSITTKSIATADVCFDRSSPQWGKEVGAAVGSGGARSTETYVTYGPTGQYRIRLIDSRGLERQGFTTAVNSVYDYVQRGTVGGLGVERVDMVCVVTGARWERGDVSLIQGLRERQVIVIVVVAKADGFALLNPDDSGPDCTESRNTQDVTNERAPLHGYEHTTSAIRKDFVSIPVFVTADVDNSLCNSECNEGERGRHMGRKLAPLQCVNGHGREWFVESRARGTWTCSWGDSDKASTGEAKACGETGTLGTEAFGVSALRRAIEHARSALAQRGILQDQKGIVTRARVEVSREMEQVFWNAMTNSEEFSKTMCAQARKAACFVGEQYVAMRVISQALSDDLIDKESIALARRSRGPMGIFRSFKVNVESDTNENNSRNVGRQESNENAKPVRNNGWMWSFMTKNVSAAVMGMSVQTVMMGCAFSLEHVLFVDAGGSESNMYERFATILSKFCKESEVDKMSEVRGRFGRGKTRADAAICENFERLTGEVVTDISRYGWGQQGYE